MLGISWGASFSVAKIAAEGGGHPLGLNYWQSLIGAVLLIIYLTIKRIRLPLSWKHLSLYFICGALGSFIPGVIYFYAVIHVSPGILAITMAMIPIMTYVAATLTKIEPRSFIRLLGIGFGILSIVLLVAPLESQTDRSAIPWILAMVVAALCYAAENIVLAHWFPKGSSVIQVLCGMYVASCVMMTPFVLAIDAFVPLGWPFSHSEWAITGLALLSVACYGLFLVLIINVGPIFASQTAYIITVAGVFWGMLLFNDNHSGWVWASLISVLIAILLVTPQKKLINK